MRYGIFYTSTTDESPTLTFPVAPRTTARSPTIDCSSRASSMTAWALMMESLTCELITRAPSPMDAYGPTTDPSRTADGLIYEGEITVDLIPAETAGGTSFRSSLFACRSASTVPQSYQ